MNSSTNSLASFKSKAMKVSKVVTVQPGRYKPDILTMNIGNAAEFLPHPKINALKPFDTLLVNQESDVVEVITQLEQSNKYKILTINGSVLYQVTEGKKPLIEIDSKKSWRQE